MGFVCLCVCMSIYARVYAGVGVCRHVCIYVHVRAREQPQVSPSGAIHLSFLTGSLIGLELIK